jgi:hypothetical protein
MAQRDGATVKVHVRVAKHSVGADDKHYLDLCNEEGDVVEYDAEGWRLVSEPPVIFMRYENMLALPTPIRPDSDEQAKQWVHDGLMRLLNIEHSDYTLITSWLLAALRQLGGYPILSINGPAGSAKTTGAKIIADLVDPHAAKTGGEPRDEQSYFISCYRRHVIVGDNLSNVRRDRSDMYCRVATGGSYEARTHYANKENTVLSVCRPQIITGVNNVVKATDLATRCLFIKLKEIPKHRRLGDEQMEREFKAWHGKILGALLHIACKGLANGQHVETGEVRMVDFERIAKKCEPYYAVNGDTFSRSNAVANTEIQEETLAGELTFQCMLDVLKPKDGCHVWDNGRIQELWFDMGNRRSQLNGMYPRDAHFPANPIHLSRWLTSQKNALEAVGCKIGKKKTKQGVRVTVTIPTDTHIRLSHKVDKFEPQVDGVVDQIAKQHQSRRTYEDQWLLSPKGKA